MYFVFFCMLKDTCDLYNASDFMLRNTDITEAKNF